MWFQKSLSSPRRINAAVVHSGFTIDSAWRQWHWQDLSSVREENCSSHHKSHTASALWLVWIVLFFLLLLLFFRCSCMLGRTKACYTPANWPDHKWNWPKPWRNFLRVQHLMQITCNSCSRSLREQSGFNLMPPWSLRERSAYHNGKERIRGNLNCIFSLWP